MAQDLKISQLPVYSLGTDIASLMLAGKIVVPATINENNILNNRGLDIGQLLSLLKVYVDQAAATAVQNVIDQGEISGGGSIHKYRIKLLNLEMLCIIQVIILPHI